jgi:hypothetical protein
MRAWTIVLFILAIHGALLIINVANITDIGLNVSVDTTSKSGIIVAPPGSTNVYVPSPNPNIFNESAGNDSIQGTALLGSDDFVSKFIETVVGLGTAFLSFMTMFSKLILSIQTTAAPFFGEFNAWVLQIIVGVIFGVSLVQILSGRSFKTME